jgi:hypothetical protein
MSQSFNRPAIIRVSINGSRYRNKGVCKGNFEMGE